MSNGDNFAAISHWLIEPRTAVPSDTQGRLRRMIVAADSAAAARQYAERWRMSRPFAVTGPFTDQHHYLVRRLPDQLVPDQLMPDQLGDEPGPSEGVIHSELLKA